MGADDCSLLQISHVASGTPHMQINDGRSDPKPFMGNEEAVTETSSLTVCVPPIPEATALPRNYDTMPLVEASSAVAQDTWDMMCHTLALESGTMYASSKDLEYTSTVLESPS